MRAGAPPQTVMLGTTVPGGSTAPGRSTAQSRITHPMPCVSIRTTYHDALCADFYVAADLGRLDHRVGAQVDVAADAQGEVGNVAA